jgi:hypothetical protein
LHRLGLHRRMGQIEEQASEQQAHRQKLSPRYIPTLEEIKQAALKGPVFFCDRILNLKPTEYQLEFLDEIKNRHFIALIWCRQSGKSHIVAAVLFWISVLNDGYQTGVVGPSFRQSKLIIRKINAFIQGLPKEVWSGRKPLKTKVALWTGSVIDAFPNNPETIRGPTLNFVYADEFNFVKDGEEMYDAILFTLGTTNGQFVCSSTPWSRDHIFYRICHEKEFDDFKRIHVAWNEALEPKGPLKKTILAKIQRQLETDPWRWRREMEAEWAEDEDSWLPTSLITQCTDPTLEIREFGGELHSFWAMGLGTSLPR